jgi:hypothetical protein
MVVVKDKKISAYISTTSSLQIFDFKHKSLHLDYIKIKLCFLNLIN